MKKTLSILAIVAVSTIATAGTINTGVNNSNVPLGPSNPSNVPDPHFSVTSNVAGQTALTAITIQYLYGAYFTSGGNPIGTANASWITTNLGVDAGATSPGTYTFTEALTGVTTFTANWATDNCGTVSVSSGLVSGATT